MSVILIEFKTFKEKIAITKEYNRKGRIEILDNKYVYIEMEGEVDKYGR